MEARGEGSSDADPEAAFRKEDETGEMKRQRQGAISQSWWASAEGLVWGRRRQRWGVRCWAGGHRVRHPSD